MQYEGPRFWIKLVNGDALHGSVRWHSSSSEAEFAPTMADLCSWLNSDETSFVRVVTNDKGHEAIIAKSAIVRIEPADPAIRPFIGFA